MTDHIVSSTEGALGRLTIDREDKLNSFTGEMLVTMREKLLALSADPAVRVIVIDSAGDRAFSTGADLAEMRDMDSQSVLVSNRRWIDLFATIEAVPEPVVASVRGHAIAGGTELSLSCDMVVATDDATFGLTEMRVGVIPGAGACVRLVRWVGRARAKQILMTGEPISAQLALEWGLVNEVVPAGDLDRATGALCELLASRSPLALGAAKRAVNIGGELDQTSGIEYVLREFALLFESEDQREGMAAFLEKRRPDFRGR